MYDSIIQWNMRSWRSNFCDLKKIIQDTNPISICLQETLMTDTHVHPPSRYNIIHSSRNRPDDHYRGVAILTHVDYHTHELHLSTSLQAVAVKIWINKWYTICSLYLPHTTISPESLRDLISELPTPFIILGDFNARSETWGDTTSNARGRMLEDLLID